MNVLEVVDGESNSPGGVSKVVRSLSEAIASLGEECAILETGKRGPAAVSTINGVRIFSMGVGRSDPLSPFRLSFLSRARAHRGVVRQPDVVHVHGFHSPHMLASLLVFSDCPIVMSTHFHGRGHSRLAVPFFPLYRIAGAATLRIPQRVIAVSRFEQGLLTRDFPWIRGRIAVIPNGVDGFRPFFLRRNSLKGSLNLLTVSRLEEYKGILFVLRALKKIESLLGMNVTYRVVGAGPYEQVLKREARILEVERNVIWHEILDDIQLGQAYDEADVFILLSEAEAYGLVVAEALSHGLPCVVLRKGALADFEGTAGVSLVEDKTDADCVANTVTEVATRSPSEAVPFNQSLIRGWDLVAQEHIQLFKDVLNLSD